VLASLIALTLLVTLVFDRVTSAEVMVNETGFDDELPSWQINSSVEGAVSVQAGIVSIEQSGNRTTTGLSRLIILPAGNTEMRLTATASAHDISAGDLEWQVGRITYVQIDEAGVPDWSIPHHLMRLSGDVRSTSYSADFVVPEEVSTLKISVELAQASGKLEVSELTLVVTQPSSRFWHARLALIVAWAMAITLGSFIFYRSTRAGTARVTLLIVGLLIVVGVFSPVALIHHLTDWLQSHIPVSRPAIEFASHFVFFAVFAFVLRITRDDTPVYRLLIFCILAAATTEVMQLLTQERSPDPVDWIANVLGAVVGLVAGYPLAEKTRISRLIKTHL